MKSLLQPSSQYECSPGDDGSVVSRGADPEGMRSTCPSPAVWPLLRLLGGERTRTEPLPVHRVLFLNMAVHPRMALLVAVGVYEEKHQIPAPCGCAGLRAAGHGHLRLSLRSGVCRCGLLWYVGACPPCDGLLSEGSWGAVGVSLPPHLATTQC